MKKKKQILVVSGKGGAGKTTISAILYELLQDCLAIDCDVDASNLYLLTKPQVKETTSFYGGKKAFLNPYTCIECGACVSHCFCGAIEENPMRIKSSCEGCGLCYHICKQKAISMQLSCDGESFSSQTRFGPMIHARLHPGADNSGKLIASLRKKAETVEGDFKYILLDGPPGLGCPVRSSMTGCDFVVLVVEPSVTGFHDAQRLYELIQFFDIPVGVFINKSDIYPENLKEIQFWYESLNLPFLGELPFLEEVTLAQKKEQTLVEYFPESRKYFKTILHFLTEVL